MAGIVTCISFFFSFPCNWCIQGYSHVTVFFFLNLSGHTLCSTLRPSYQQILAYKKKQNLKNCISRDTRRTLSNQYYVSEYLVQQHFSYFNANWQVFNFDFFYILFLLIIVRLKYIFFHIIIKIFEIHLCKFFYTFFVFIKLKFIIF